MTNEADTRRVVSVVLNWRKAKMTEECVSALLRSNYAQHEVLIVDNGSGDGSANYLSTRFPQLTVIASKDNLGFSRGCNLGIRHALAVGADYISLVNNDLILNEGAITAAVEALDSNPHYGAVTGKIFSSAPNIIWQAGGKVSHFRVMALPRGKGEVDTGQYDSPGTTGWASGAMTIFRTSALKAIGLLPEEYFFGQEEWDMSTALQRSGFSIGYEPRYVGHHAGGGSYQPHPALNSYGATRNRHLYAEKYLSSAAYRWWRMAFWIHLHLIMRSKMAVTRSLSDPSVHVRAMRLAWRRHKSGQPVTLAELNSVSQELGIHDSWDTQD